MCGILDGACSQGPQVQAEHPGLPLAFPLSWPGRHPALAYGVLCSTLRLGSDEGGDTKNQATTQSQEGSSVWLETVRLQLHPLS